MCTQTARIANGMPGLREHVTSQTRRRNIKGTRRLISGMCHQRGPGQRSAQSLHPSTSTSSLFAVPLAIPTPDLAIREVIPTNVGALVDEQWPNGMETPHPEIPSGVKKVCGVIARPWRDRVQPWRRNVDLRTTRGAIAEAEPADRRETSCDEVQRLGRRRVRWGNCS